MSDYATHLAAIGVGVAIALYFVSGSKNNTNTATEQTTTAKVATDTTTASSNGGAAKNKKKSKKKKAAPSKKTAAAPTPEPVVSAPEDESWADPAPVTVAEKKKPKKSKKNGSAVKTANKGNNNKNANTTPAPAPTPAPPVPAPAVRTPFQSRIVEEDGWETIPKKSKKKKFPKQQAAPGLANAAATNGASLSVTIDASRIGIIIGPKGATMNAIQEKTGTKLDVNAPKLDDTKPSGNNQRSSKKQTATVVITEGTSETRQLAKTTILDLADRGYAALLQAEGFGESSVSVHPRFLSEIVGPGGKIIKAIQSNLDVKLTIPKTDWTPKTMQVSSM